MTDLLELYLRWSGLPDDAQTRSAMSDWRMVTYWIDCKPAAIAAVSGSEIHLAVDPDWRGRIMTRGRVRLFLAGMINEIGYLTTRTADLEHHNFLVRIGFEPTWSEPGTYHYMITDLPFGGEKKPCHLQ